MLLLCALIVGSGTMWGDEGDELAICQGTGSGYGTRRTLTDSHSVGWVLASGQSGYLGANNATNHGNVKPTAADLPVVKAVKSDATTSTTGYYFYYTTTAVENVGSIEFSYTGNSGNSSATAYVVVGDALSKSGGDAYEVIELSSTSTTAQNASLGTSGTFTYTFNETQKDARYYGFIIVTNSYKRLTAGTIKLKEGANACATPTFSPTGGTYTSAQSVTLSCATDGATIRYTTDGSTPTSASTEYTSAITVNKTMTIKAKAFKTDMDDSDEVSATYTLKCVAPTFTPVAGTVDYNTAISLSTTTDGATIYYTIDDTTPTSGSTAYDASSKPTIDVSKTIKAIAVKSGWNDSDVSTAAYTANYTILAESNDDDMGVLLYEEIKTTSTGTLTAIPVDGYRVKAGTAGYTLLDGTATVTNNEDNTFTVTPTTDCMIRINFEVIPKYTVTFNAEGGSCGTESLEETIGGGGVTLPTATCNKSGWVFAGWATAPVTNTGNRPTLYLSGEKFYPTSATSLYAVYTLEGVDGTKYMRATQLSDVTSATNLIVVNSDMAIDDALGSVSSPIESEGMITPSENIVWSLSGNNTDGFTLTTTSLTANKNLGITSIPASYGNVSLTNDNSRWIIETHTGGENLFVLRNKTNPSDNSKVGVLEYSNSKWKYYCISANTYNTTNNYSKSKLYIPVLTVYNSNPTADIIQPEVEFEKGNTTLYLDGTTTYSNAASVTGVNKSVTGYKSSDEDVATVAADGTITAIGIGTATITAYLDAELGVHKAAQATYNVVVKSTTTVAGLKAITSSSTAVDFAADLTDAVVTYVEPTATSKYAYIQDATAAIMVYISNGHGLTAGQKINGAVSGQVKASYSIQQISSINVSDATVTEDGVIHAAEEKTLAYIVANAASLDGKKVLVKNATVSNGMNNTTSGGVITDDGGNTTVNIIAPNNLTLKATEVGNFTGFVSTYVNGNNTTYRLNLYEASQYQKTQNVETAQTLSFANNAVALDEVTSELTEFTGQTVSGAHTTVTYSKTDASSIIGDFNTSTGALTLNGTCGTATITATAAAENVVENGVTTPYTEATKSYTITVSPRYIVTFSVNGIETTLRQATSGASITVPTPDDIDGYKFVGWKTTTLEPTDDKPSFASIGATVTPEDYDDIYYAVFANQTQTGTGGSYELDYATDVQSCSGYGNTKNVTASDGSAWVVKAYDNSGMQINTGKNSSVKVPTCPGNITSVIVTCTNANKNAVGFSASDYTGSGTISYLASGSTSTSQTLDLSGKSVEGGYVVPKGGVAVITHIVVNYGPTYSYDDYRTSLPSVEIEIPSSKYLSFCYGSKLDFSETTVKAYKASVDGEGKVTLTKVDVVPAGEGVILHADADTYSIPVTDKEASDVTGNEMVGVLTRTQVLWNPSTNVYNYILQQGQFYKATDGYLKANRAYLSTTYDVTAPGARSLNIVFDDGETTGISATLMNNETMNNEYFDLQGRKVANPTKGLYIVNGRKVVVK